MQVRDSIVIRQVNDTIRVEKWHTQWKEKIVLKHDTVYITQYQEMPKTPSPKRGNLRLGLLMVVGIVVGLWTWRYLRRG